MMKNAFQDNPTCKTHKLDAVKAAMMITTYEFDRRQAELSYKSHLAQADVVKTNCVWQLI